MKQQWQIFLVALAFFTRIPIPDNIPYSSERLNQANRYFALVGTLIGVLTALLFLLMQSVFPLTIAIVMSMAFSLLLTGAFHEDGLADVFDGFGGGWNPEQKLDIMKDSRLGTYGASALFIALGLKWATLSAIASHSVTLTALSFVAMHTLSRAVAASLIFSYPYVRLDEQSKVKPLANEQSQYDLWVLILTSLIILLLLPLNTALCLMVVLAIVRTGCGRWFNKQLGGYTGDCLGATQQLSEIAGYLIILATVTS
ncbi:adenosylcobinamide-GDP ribazoletransferase [Photobacterium makurazakiensis]|uniref:adenosylcobinamide-GDP ribazoletransferase n=1 Tax=Photobacterium makurazakiensis TaxID=2910234 RepID=UPI003D0DD8EB